jgi:ABC-type proline/glycine betaine transport system ATPase subunit
MSDTQIKISIRSLYKIFGDSPEMALQHVVEGMGKTELLEKHNHALGLNNIDIDVPAGKTTVIMGLSGSGKSSTGLLSRQQVRFGSVAITFWNTVKSNCSICDRIKCLWCSRNLHCCRIGPYCKTLA